MSEQWQDEYKTKRSERRDLLHSSRKFVNENQGVTAIVVALIAGVFTLIGALIMQPNDPIPDTQPITQIAIEPSQTIFPTDTETQSPTAIVTIAPLATVTIPSTNTSTATIIPTIDNTALAIQNTANSIASTMIYQTLHAPTTQSALQTANAKDTASAFATKNQLTQAYETGVAGAATNDALGTATEMAKKTPTNTPTREAPLDKTNTPGPSALCQSKIIFASTDDDDDAPHDTSQDIYSADWNTENRTNITRNPSSLDWYPAVSPDGTKIAFISNRDLLELSSPFQQRELYIIPCGEGASEPKRLTEDRFDALMPSWSPDGNKIVFISNINNHNDLWIVNQDGTNLRAVTDDASNDVQPHWSKDNRLVYSGAAEDNSGDLGIYIINPDGTGKTLVTSVDDGVRDVNPHWSPDSQTIVFSREGNIYTVDVPSTMNFDPPAIELLAELNNNNVEAVFSPDGSQVLIASQEVGRKWSLIQVDLETRQSTYIGESSREYISINWQ